MTIGFINQNPSVNEQVMRFGRLGSYKTTARLTAKWARQGRIKEVGRVSIEEFRRGPKEIIYGSWRPRSPRHELLLTELAIVIFMYVTIVRGYLVDERLADMETKTKDERFAYWELDCGTHEKKAFLERLENFQNCDETLLIVTASNKARGIDSAVRLQELMRWAGEMKKLNDVRFKTLEEAVQDPFGTWVRLDGELTEIETPEIISRTDSRIALRGRAS